MDRGVYREDCFNGMVEYQIFDSNKCMIVRVEIVSGYAGKEAEDAMSNWLDKMDPTGETISPSVSSELLPSPSVLAA
jgi:hypothetical protein